MGRLVVGLVLIRHPYGEIVSDAEEREWQAAGQAEQAGGPEVVGRRSQVLDKVFREEVLADYERSKPQKRSGQGPRGNIRGKAKAL